MVTESSRNTSVRIRNVLHSAWTSVTSVHRPREEDFSCGGSKMGGAVVSCLTPEATKLRSCLPAPCMYIENNQPLTLEQEEIIRRKDEAKKLTKRAMAVGMLATNMFGVSKDDVKVKRDHRSKSLCKDLTTCCSLGTGRK